MSLLLPLLLAAVQPTPPALAFELSFAPAVMPQPFTGRLFVLAAREPIKGAPPRQNWFNPYPFFSQDVRGWKPGEPLRFRPDHAFPHSLGQLPPGKYYFQAVMDLDRGGQNPLTSPGNGYSKPVAVEVRGAAGPISLTLDQIIPEPRFEETERVKLVEIESKLLGAFHGRPVRLRAGVVLPRSFGNEP